MNIAITDGNNIVCSRYLNVKEKINPEPPSLFINNKNIDTIMIASEPTEFENTWTMVKKNSLIAITGDTSPKMKIYNIKEHEGLSLEEMDSSSNNPSWYTKWFQETLKALNS